MKEVVIMLVFLSIVSGKAIAQTSSRFPINPTSMWKIDHIRNGVSNETTHIEGDEIYSYLIHGDTIIGNHNYFKLYKTGVAYYDKPFYFENVYAGAIRDENNQFFFVEKKASKEVLLYDFTVSIGDTIRVPYQGIFEEKIVSSIGFLPDGRKTIHFNPKEPRMGCGDQYMIEGIGGSGGLIEGPVCNHFWTYDYHLVCYVQNGELVYHDNNFQFNCDLIENPEKNKLLDSTCVWRIDKQLPTDSVSDFEKITYFVCGDTLIGGIQYMKLCKNGFQLLIESDGSYFSGFHDSVYVGAIRESNRQWYFINKEGSNEVLLYDFGLQTGQAVQGIIGKGTTIVSSDSAIDNRKILFLSNDRWQNFMIEGIGTDHGLLENTDESSTLICFMKNKAPVYHNASGSECILQFDQYDFSACNHMKVLPENPKENQQIKLVSRFCYTVGYENQLIPFVFSKEKVIDENAINLTLNVEFDDQNNEGYPKVLVPVFDTIDVGFLKAGDYFAELIVNTTHKNPDHPYTVEYDKGLFLSFSVSGSDHAPGIITNNRFKIYPNPTNGFLYIEKNFEETSIVSVEMYNLSGNKVVDITMKTDEHKERLKLDVGRLNRGIYLTILKSGPSTGIFKTVIN